MRGAATLWATSQWRRRWTALVVLGLVLALTGSFAVGAAMGARRSATAFDRLRDGTHAANVALVAINDDELATDPIVVLDRLLPLIDAVGATLEERYFVRPVGTDLIPYLDIYPVVEHQLLDQPINVPVALDGRLPDPTDASEIALSEHLAGTLGVGPGDHVAFESASSEWVSTTFEGADAGGPPDGPALDLRVTGIVVSPLDFVAPEGVVYLTPAFADAHRDQIANFPGADLRLNDPARAEVMTSSGLAGSGDPELDAALQMGRSPWGESQQVTDGLRVVVAALWLLAVVVMVAGLAVTVLLVRRLARSMTDLETMAALGLDRPGRMVFGVLLVVPAVAVGIVGTVVGAIAAAPHTRLGLAGEVDPARDAFVDGSALVVGTALLATVVLAAAAISFGAVARRRARPAVTLRGPSVRWPLSLSLGIRQALNGRDGRVPSHSTIAACACLMAAVVTSLVFGASLIQLADRPELWGGGSDVILDFGERSDGAPNEPYDQALASLADDPRVSALMGRTLFDPEVGGRELRALALDTRLGAPIVTVLDGRAPATPGEIAMGRETMRRLDLDVGDDVAVTLAGVTESFRLVGRVAFPFGDFQVDEGGAFTLEGGRRFPGFETDNYIFQVLLTWADGVDQQQAGADLVAAGYPVIEARRPPVVANLEQVHRLPGVLTVFFGVLGLTALGYLLIVSARPRRRQFAVLSAVGLFPRQCAAIVRWQAVTIVGLATLVGVPAGIAVGRLLWASVAKQAGVGVGHALPVGALGLAVAGAFVGAVVLAVVSTRGDHEQRVADVLRAD